MRFRLVSLLLVLGLAAPTSAQLENVGNLSFPTSASPEAQRHFLRAVAILHSFGWKQAIAEFKLAQKAQPDFALARTGRAVVYARLGRRDDAHADAQAALNLSEEPLVTYQVACAYALTGAAHPDDLPRALGYLRKALRDGYAEFETIEADPDLKALRGLRDYREALDAAKKLVK